MEDWTKHELKILIEHHMKHARELMETAAMLEECREDGIDGDEFVVFARARLKRAMELRSRLIGDMPTADDRAQMVEGSKGPQGPASVAGRQDEDQDG
jgi:hypothetical protein